MISAYNLRLFDSCHSGVCLEEFAAQTVVATRPQSVRAALFNFLLNHETSPEVSALLTALLADPVLAGKTRVVTDPRWRNCVIRVSPRCITVAAGGVTTLDGECLIDATLAYWARNAEAIFVQLAESGSLGAQERLSVAELLENKVNRRFRRYFGDVLSPGGN